MTMRWRASSILRLVVVVLLLTLALPAWAQKPSLTPQGRSLMAELTRQGTVRPAIVSGRIIVWRVPIRLAPVQRNVGGIKEKLTIRALDRRVHADYERSGADEQVSIEIFGDVRARLARIPKEGSDRVPVEFVQPEQGPISLVVGAPGQQQVYTAPSLWHLVLAQREVCQQHLVPLLAMINDGWDVLNTGDQIEQTLVDRMAHQVPPDRRHWDGLVEQLGRERFTQREAADRELRALGPRVIWYLQTLDLKRLDPEQRFRVQRILLDLTAADQEDTTDQVARWLAGDPQAWLILLNRDEEATRRLAAEQLQYLVDRPIPFDPEADAQTRQKQWERLRQQGLGNEKGAGAGD